ncbi:hypothetical protein [Nostoc sp. LPT]|uniref:hypothetical protein n=1 Tax=Nostoc sp. LPT TaxID=2815387 RepID=UPI001D24FB4A|nr:hypothetical protein [Nostoc sp. LPT]MBN4001290.1 hypothetical protein [Nostoc sp. LPT]
METINTALCSSGLSGMVFHAPFIDLHPGFKLEPITVNAEDGINLMQIIEGLLKAAMSKTL